MGNAYSKLVEVENLVVNITKTIAAYEEALTVYVIDKFPEKYNSINISLKKLFELINKSNYTQRQKSR